MAVALLANAIRAEAHHGRPGGGRPIGALLPGVTGRGRADGARRYAQGMRDLLAVLFADGRATADACYRDARAQALGDDADP